MSRWKKVLLVLVAIILVIQIPSWIAYFRTSALAVQIAELEKGRSPGGSAEYNEYKGVIHIHSGLGGHSTGQFEELIAGAKSNGLDYVVMTEHTSELFDTSSMTLRGPVQGVIFVNGSETRAKDGNRFIFVEGSPDAHDATGMNTPEIIEKVKGDGRLAFVAYPEDFKSESTAFDGIEVFSLNTNLKKANLWVLLPSVWGSIYGFPELTLARYFTRPEKSLKMFDEVSKVKRLTLFAGNDAHSNIGFHLLGDDAGNKIFNLKFDRYETVFRMVRTHILVNKESALTNETLKSALKNGNAFIGIDIIGDTTGFMFSASNANETVIMGEQIEPANGEVTMKVNVPSASRIVLLKDGIKIAEQKESRQFTYKTSDQGAYRIEVYRDVLEGTFGKMPWIISNPIYLRERPDD